MPANPILKGASQRALAPDANTNSSDPRCIPSAGCLCVLYQNKQSGSQDKPEGKLEDKPEGGGLLTHEGVGDAGQADEAEGGEVAAGNEAGAPHAALPQRPLCAPATSAVRQRREMDKQACAEAGVWCSLPPRRG